ncbi:hypothetical protein LTR95_016308 [Oleoguttula sp. CCFEE 5521]
MVYSLLGLLDISMPVMYGKGRSKAQQRLDNEINAAQRGPRHYDFSLAFSLAEAAVETSHFVARKSELQEIRANLISDGSRRTVVPHGLGGIGKTQLAMAYAKRYKDKYSALLWLNARDEDSVKRSFVKMAKQILRERPSALQLASLDMDQDLKKVVEAVKAWLSTAMNARWPMICDNYDNPKVPGNTDAAALELRQCLPEAYQGAVLVTTRSSEVKLGHCIQIKKLEALQDSLEILEHASGRSKLTDDENAVQFAQNLEGLPLALATAGAYLSQSTTTFAEYLRSWEQSWARLQKHSPASMTYENGTLYFTWQVTFEQIEHRNSLSARLLRLWAYFDNQDLWFELLDHISDHELEWTQEPTGDELDFEDRVRVLCDHGLVEANAQNEYKVESTGYSVHGCAHAWMLAVLNAQFDNDLARVALGCVASHVPSQNPSNGSLMQWRLLNHVVRCSIYISNVDDESDLDWVYHVFGDLYVNQGKLAEAETMYKRALRGREKALGPEHMSTLHTINKLGNLYSEQGKLAEAETMYQRALQGREKAFGPEHTSTLDTVHNLGNLCRNQGKLAEAEGMYQRAL